MSVENALRALLLTILNDAACALLFNGRVYDQTAADAERDGKSMDLPEGRLRCWLGPMNLRFGDACRGHDVQLRIFVEGMTQSRAPIWDAALKVAAALEGASNPAFGPVAFLRPISDVIEPGPIIAVAIDIGFRIPG